MFKYSTFKISYRVIVILLYLFSSKTILAQSLPCNEINNYSNYLNQQLDNIYIQKDGLLIPTEQLYHIGKCYVMADEFKVESQNYIISDSLIVASPGYICLLLNSRSLSRKEKQTWLDLLNVMDDNYRSDFTNILFRERIKYKEIEVKYKIKKDSIGEIYNNLAKKDLSEILETDKKFQLLFLVKYEHNHEIAILRKTEKGFLDLTGRRIIPETAFLLLNFFEDEGSDLPMIGFLVKAYSEMMLQQKHLNSDSISVAIKRNFQNSKFSDDQIFEYYDKIFEYLIKKYKNNSSVGVGIEKILNINFRELSKYRNSNRIRLFNAYYYYSNLHQFKKVCSVIQEIIDAGFFQLKSPIDFSFALYNLAILERKEIQSCHDCIELLSEHLLKLSSKENIISSLETQQWSGIKSHPVLVDLYIKYGSNEELMNLSIQLKAFFDRYSDDSIGFYSNEWYYELNKKYRNGHFSKQKKLSKLNKEAKKIALAKAMQEGINIETSRMEYLCHYALYQIVYSDYDSKNIEDVLNEIIQLGNNPSLPTFSHIEKHIAKYLYDNMLVKTVDNKGPKIIPFNFDSETFEEEVIFQGTISDQSKIKILQINYRETKIEGNAFSINIPLFYGNNNIHVYAEDIHGNTTEITKNILKKEVVDKFSIRKDRALIFALDTYKHWGYLGNPILDAEEVGKELRENYGFEVEIIKNPSDTTFLNKLFEYVEKDYNPYDQLFIYFTGHGDLDKRLNKGYLVFENSPLPKNDKFRKNYLSLDDFKSTINNIDCSNIFLMLDACHAGLIDSDVINREKNKGLFDEFKEGYVKATLKYKARPYLTSVGNKFASDGISGQHSPFARGILKALRTYGGKDKILTFEELISQIQTVRNSIKSNEITSGDFCQYGRFGEEDPGSNFFFIYNNK